MLRLIDRVLASVLRSIGNALDIAVAMLLRVYWNYIFTLLAIVALLSAYRVCGHYVSGG